MSPIIGISSYHREGDIPAFSVPCGYIDAVRSAGGTPLVLTPGEKLPGRLLDLIDGLLLAGGGDIAPARYGAAAHPTLYMISEERDEFELELALAALSRPELPVLSICRGLQVMNVATGGTLHPHIPDQFGEGVLHRAPPRLPTRHPVRIADDSRLAAIMGSSRIDACSWHHQAVDRLGDNLEAVAWSDDGVVEALVHDRHPWCFAVQWHPEMQFDEPAQSRLFESFVKQARPSSSSSSGRA